MSASPESWQPVSVSLPFRLGEIALFSRTFEGFADRRHFTALAPYTSLPKPPDHFDPQPELVFFPTYPVAFDPPVVASVGRWIAYTPYTFHNHFVDLERLSRFDDYLKQFSSKSRSTLQRKVKKFAEASGGEIAWKAYTAAHEMDDFFRAARIVSSRTYQERLLGSGLPGDDAFRERTKALASHGSVLGFVLFLQGKPVAYLFCHCRDGIVTYDYLGYDPDAQVLSPGSVLQYLVLRFLFAQGGFRIFDFTEGEGAQKAFFGTDERLCAKTYYLRNSRRNRLLVRLHYGMNGFVEQVGAALDRVGLKSAVRKLIRRAA